tara:strand:+ start:461 stop:1285 length:825 start_codon:yes stop_codon:yes gene_type:complete
MSIPVKPNSKEHFNSFMNLLNSRKPFTFIRFSDGEVEVLRNRKLTIENKKTFFRGKTYSNNYPEMDTKKFDPLTDQKFRSDLLDSSIFKSEFFYKGIRTFSINDSESIIDREFLLRLNGGFDSYLTFSDLLINENYLQFRSKMFKLILNNFKNIVVVSNWRSIIKFKFHRHIKVCDNFIKNYQYEMTSILNTLINIPLNSVVLCSASSLTNILGHKLYLLRPDITFLDVGTSINDLFSLQDNTRVYHKLLNKFKKYPIPIKFLNLLINDLLIRW